MSTAQRLQTDELPECTQDPRRARAGVRGLASSTSATSASAATAPGSRRATGSPAPAPSRAPSCCCSEDGEWRITRPGRRSTGRDCATTGCGEAVTFGGRCGSARDRDPGSVSPSRSRRRRARLGLSVRRVELSRTGSRPRAKLEPPSGRCRQRSRDGVGRVVGHGAGARPVDVAVDVRRRRSPNGLPAAGAARDSEATGSTKSTVARHRRS